MNLTTINHKERKLSHLWDHSKPLAHSLLPSWIYGLSLLEVQVLESNDGLVLYRHDIGFVPTTPSTPNSQCHCQQLHYNVSEIYLLEKKN